jgi:uncharacterized membrane protein YdjX (TVP38/TMEM64 family)
VLFGFWRGLAVIWVGMILGCAIGYAFGARAAGAARKLVGSDSLAKAGKVMEQHGSWALVICRPIPVLAESSIVFAGLVRSPVTPFIWLTTLSNLGIAIAYAAVGAFSMKTESFLWTFVGAIALPGVAMLIGKLFVTKNR